MGKRNLVLVADVTVIVGDSTFLQTRGEEGGIVGGVPLEDVDRGDNSVPQEGDEDGGVEVETEVYSYWDLLDKLAGIGGSRLRTSGSGGTRY